MRVSGLILCGGQGRRMQGRDKGWVEIAGTPMIERVIDRFRPQVDEIFINANRNITRYQKLNLVIVEDVIKGFEGPLAGILSGMTICKTDYLVCIPCDCPFYPTDLVMRMLEKQESTAAEIVSVDDGVRTHPVFALINTNLFESLNDYLQSGQRKIDRWYQQHNYQLVDYQGALNSFDNINTPEQLHLAEQQLLNHG